MDNPSTNQSSPIHAPRHENHASDHHGHTHPSGQLSAHPHHAPSTRPEPKSRAWMIGGILIILLLIVGILIYTKFTTPSPRDTIPPVTPVSIKLLVDSSCKFCPQTNTILAKLDESNVKYAVETIDVKSDAGKTLVKEYDVEYAPTALVNVIGLDQNSTIQRALQGQFIQDPLKIKKGWVIVPEKFLDGQPKLLTFIKQPGTCTIPEGKIHIRAQLDYGDCRPCAEAYRVLQNLSSAYDHLEIEYVPMMYARPTLSKIAEALQTNKGAICAERQGYLNEYTECNFFNVPFYGNLDINYMRSCIREAGVTSSTKTQEFVSCVQDENSGAEQALIANITESQLWNPIRFTPSFVIDCTYSFVGQNSLPAYLCSLHPELEGCSDLLAAIEQADQHATQDVSRDLNILTGEDANTV